MLVKFLESPQKFIASHRREKNFSEAWLFVGASGGEIRCNLYATLRRTYCCFWLHAGELHHSGTGYAEGCGYHRESAAVQEAIANAKIRLSDDIAGCGDHAIESALHAIAAAAGMVGRVVHVHP